MFFSGSEMERWNAGLRMGSRIAEAINAVETLEF